MTLYVRPRSVEVGRCLLSHLSQFSCFLSDVSAFCTSLLVFMDVQTPYIVEFLYSQGYARSRLMEVFSETNFVIIINIFSAFEPQDHCCGQNVSRIRVHRPGFHHTYMNDSVKVTRGHLRSLA